MQEKTNIQTSTLRVPKSILEEIKIYCRKASASAPPFPDPAPGTEGGSAAECPQSAPHRPDAKQNSNRRDPEPLPTPASLSAHPRSPSPRKREGPTASSNRPGIAYSELHSDRSTNEKRGGV